MKHRWLDYETQMVGFYKYFVVRSTVMPADNRCGADVRRRKYDNTVTGQSFIQPGWGGWCCTGLQLVAKNGGIRQKPVGMPDYCFQHCSKSRRRGRRHVEFRFIYLR